MIELIKRMGWLVFLIGVATAAVSDGTPPAQEADPEDTAAASVVPAGETKMPEGGLAIEPWRQEILELRRAADERCAELQAAFDAEPDAARRLELETEMRELKLGTQLQVLAVQVREARTRGQEDAARELEQVIEFLEEERGTNEPLPRGEVKRQK